MRIILASGSPRRKELLEKAGVQFEIIPAEGEEKITTKEPAGVVKNLSDQKASEVFERICGNEDLLVIGADTIVSFEGKILGKPKDHKEASDMLHMLNGNTHQVYTGVTLISMKDGAKEKRTFCECTDVVFDQASDEEIEEYCASGEPMDKAGAYAVQGGWGPHVIELRGDYDTVVGLPVARLLKELEDLC